MKNSKKNKKKGLKKRNCEFTEEIKDNKKKKDNLHKTNELLIEDFDNFSEREEFDEYNWWSAM